MKIHLRGAFMILQNRRIKMHSHCMFLIALLCLPAAAKSETYTQEIKLDKGTAKVTFVSVDNTKSYSNQKSHPTVGITSIGQYQFGDFLAKSLDETNKVKVVSPAKLAAEGGDFESLTRSEFSDFLADTCKKGKLDYLLVAGPVETTSKTDISAYIIGIGKTRSRNKEEFRLYECQNYSIVWDQNVTIEGAQGIWSSAFSGFGSQYGPGPSKAIAPIFADKLIKDMNW